MAIEPPKTKTMISTSNTKDLIDFGNWYRSAIVQKTTAISVPMEAMVEVYYKSKQKQKG